MTSGDWEAVEALFHSCASLTEDQREEFLLAECRGNEELLAAVRRLLAADSDSEGSDFLKPPPVDRLGPLLSTDVAELVAGRSLGVYRLVRKIGSGGMGSVWLATRDDQEFEREVAIKTLRSGACSPEQLDRLRRERQTLAALDHPHIARLFDGGTSEDGIPYLIMEYVDGLAIDAWCDQRSLGLAARLTLFAAVGRVVAHAHRCLVVHRDLKPANVLIDARGQPKLLDFGIAWDLGAKEPNGESRSDGVQRAQTLASGTPAYASPEQRRAEPVSTSSDIYSLGALLYKLLSGQPPDPDEQRRRLSSEAARHDDLARRWASALTGDLDAMLARALASEPGARYASVEALLEDLRRHREHEPVTARPAGLGLRMAKALRRQPLGFALSFVLALVLAAWLVDGLRSAAELRRNHDQVLRLADLHRLDELRKQVAGLPPADPLEQDRLEDWVQRAEALVRRGALHRQTLDSLRSRAETEEVAGQSTWTFDSREERWEHDSLVELIAELEELSDEKHGDLPRMRARLDFARTMHEQSIEDYEEDWRRVIAATADPDSPYQGLELSEQPGLVPLGPDPVTGFEEFWHVESGQCPEPAEDGGWCIAAETGLVFVLLPAGRYSYGAIPPDVRHPIGSPNVDPGAQTSEQPLRYVEVYPFFLSRYEMTQAQWVRASYDPNPSAYARYESPTPEFRASPSHPVENVSWAESQLALRGWGLELPSEVQWEYAARAGTTTPYWSGETADTLRGRENLHDRTYQSWNAGKAGSASAVDEDDGFVGTAPVDALAPNPFGFHHMLGNVGEWALDRFHQDLAHVHVKRGSAFNQGSFEARCSYRAAITRDYKGGTIGVRPARALR